MKERELFFWIGVGVYITGWFIAAVVISFLDKAKTPSDRIGAAAVAFLWPAPLVWYTFVIIGYAPSYFADLIRYFLPYKIVVQVKQDKGK